MLEACRESIRRKECCKYTFLGGGQKNILWVDRQTSIDLAAGSFRMGAIIIISEVHRGQINSLVEPFVYSSVRRS